MFSGLILSSCKAEVKKETAQYFIFDTVVDITAYGENSENAVNAVRELLYRYDALLSTTDENSEIYRLNNNETASVSYETAEIIKSSLEISSLTGGCLDITVYPLVELWGFTSGSYRVPEQQEIEEKLSYVGFEKITLDGVNVSKESPQVEIDLGATAKGYIGVKAAEAIRNAGCSSAVLSIGGNVVTVGNKPDGEEFNVGITWTDGEKICATVALKDMSAITSGTYQRNFTEDGVFYHHIIDPKTGYPAVSDIGSVTIFSENGLAADGLSTALFVMGSESCIDFFESCRYEELNLQSFDFMIIKNDGTCIVTENIYSKMKLNSDCIDEDKIVILK